MDLEQIASFKRQDQSELHKLGKRTASVRQDVLQTFEGQSTAEKDGLDHAKTETDLTARLEVHQLDLYSMRRLRDALNRIDAGTFGQCEECEETIDQRRLSALPTATLCMSCQTHAERSGGNSEGVRKNARDSFIAWSFGPARYGVA